MRIVITSQGNTLDSPLDPRFGRARSFIVCDTETGATHAVDVSANMNLAQGAGIQAAQMAADAGAEAGITGHVGPKAFTALNRGHIAVYLCDLATPREALAAFIEGKLRPADTADREGHW